MGILRLNCRGQPYTLIFKLEGYSDSIYVHENNMCTT